MGSLIRTPVKSVYRDTLIYVNAFFSPLSLITLYLRPCPANAFYTPNSKFFVHISSFLQSRRPSRKIDTEIRTFIVQTFLGSTILTRPDN